MVSGDTPERQVMDSIIKVRWQTYVMIVFREWWWGEYVHVRTEEGTIAMGSGQNRHQLRSFAVVIYMHKITVVSGCHTEVKLSFFVLQLCQLLCTAILYQNSAKFRSTNIVAIKILSPTSKFNFCQCFNTCICLQQGYM